MRRNAQWIGVMGAVVTLAVGCAGGQNKASESGFAGLGPNAPEWVVRGSRVEKGRVFGVGAATGIQNLELARSTSANRGRAEISKILEVYSASLMKDYQESVTAGDFSSSSESQMVQQAIKTFSANLMNGTEVIEYWADQGRTVYALVQLDFERARDAAAAQAEMSPGLRGWLDQNGDKVLADLDDDMKSPPAGGGGGGGGGAPGPDPMPPPPEPAPKPAPPVVAQNDGPKATVGGAPPAWTQNQCNLSVYLCGVASGRDQKLADNEARAELAKIFKANIQAVATSFQSAASKINSVTGERWEEAQKVTSFSMVSTDKVLSMSMILERWDDGKGKKWTLAVIDRAQAGAALRDQIEQKDSIIDGHVRRAEDSDDQLTRFKALRQAVAQLVEREALNSDLRVVDRSGKGIPAPHDIGEILNLLEGAASSLSIGVLISGSGADRVQACLEEGLTARGFQVEAATSEDAEDEPDLAGNFDVLIKGTVKAEKKGKIAGSETVKVTLTVKVVNGKTNKVVQTVSADRQASRGDLKAAASTASYQLCKQKVPNVIEAIDRYFKK